MKTTFWLELIPKTNQETNAIETIVPRALWQSKPGLADIQKGAQLVLVEMEIPEYLWDVHIAEGHVTDRIWKNPIAEHVTQLQKTEAELRGDHTGNPTF